MHSKLTLGLIGGAASLAAIASAFAGVKSGLQVGESVSPFHPNHIVGPLAGKDACFPCTYGNAPQVQVFVHGDSADNTLKIAKKLDAAVAAGQSKGLRAMMVFVANKPDWSAKSQKIKSALAANKLTHLHISMVEPTHEVIANYKINLAPEVKNTVFFYRNWKVLKSETNLVANTAGEKSIAAGVKSILK